MIQTDAHFRLLLTTCGTKLTTLRCDHFQNINFNLLSNDIADRCPNLTCLELSASQRVDDCFIEVISVRCSNLTTLSVSRSFLTLDGIHTICNRIKQLQSLNIGAFANVPLTADILLHVLTNLPKLRRLDISHSTTFPTCTGELIDSAFTHESTCGLRELVCVGLGGSGVSVEAIKNMQVMLRRKLVLTADLY